MIRARHIVPLIAVSCAAGLGAASLAAGAKEQPRRPRVVYAPPVALGCVATAVAVPRGPKGTAPRTPRATTGPGPSAKLLAAFGVLRRPHAAADALPASALARLRGAGARFDPAAARLLRTTPRGGRAWIVPVADVRALSCAIGAPAFGRVVRLNPRTGRIVIPAAPIELPPVRAPRIRVPSAVPAAPAAPAPARPGVRRLPRTAVPRPAPPVLYQTVPGVPLMRALRSVAVTPQEGVAVVALGDAPSGGGGSLTALLRARGVPSVEPCSGPGGGLVAISGLAPDGIGEAFLTSPDGTAIKTTIRGNAYAFIVPPSRSVEPRYVVWMKQGLPQVSPVAPGLTAGARSRVRCPAARAKAIRLSPSDDLFTTARVLYGRAPAPLMPATAVAVPKRLRLPQAVPVTPAPRLVPPTAVMPAPAPARPVAPKTRPAPPAAPAAPKRAP